MTKRAIKLLLLVEDNAGDARLIREMFNEQGANDTELLRVGNMSEAEQCLAEHPIDIILLDLGLPDSQGLEAVRRAHAAAPRVPLVVLTGLDDESLAGQALQVGAQDYLIKGQIETRGLLRALRYAVERKAMEEALFVEKERAQVTLNCIGDAVICTDTAGNITFLNLVAEKMTSWSRQEAAGRPMAEVFRILDATTREVTPNPMERSVEQNRTVHLPSNCILVRRDGIGDSHRRFRRAHPRPRGKGHRSGDRLSGCERGARHGAGDDPFGAARFSDRHAESHAAERPREPSHHLGAAEFEKSRRPVPGPGWIQAHQRFPGPPDGRQTSAIRRQTPGGLRARLRYRQPPGRR